MPPCARSSRRRLTMAPQAGKLSKSTPRTSLPSPVPTLMSLVAQQSSVDNLKALTKPQLRKFPSPRDPPLSANRTRPASRSLTRTSLSSAPTLYPPRLNRRLPRLQPVQRRTTPTLACSAPVVWDPAPCVKVRTLLPPVTPVTTVRPVSTATPVITSTPATTATPVRKRPRRSAR